MTLPKVYFDETGNTGDNLLDSSQSIYCLLSTNLSDAESSEILSLIETNAQELHFKTVKKSYAQQRQVLKVLNHSSLTPEWVKLVIADKEYAVAGHVIDRLVEPLLYDMDHDGYASGINHFFANALYAIGKYGWGQERFSKFLMAFQRMIREKTSISIDEFYKIVHIELMQAGTEKDMLGLIMQSIEQVEDILSRIRKYDLDLSLTSFSILSDMWGRQFDGKFDVIHDDSKQVKHFQKYIAYLSSSAIPTRTVGFGDRTMKFPFSINNVELVNSKTSSSVQLADILVSSVGYAANKARVDPEDTFAKEILKSRLLDIPAHQIWPSKEVIEPNFEETAGENMLDFLADAAAKNPDAFKSARPD